MVGKYEMLVFSLFQTIQYLNEPLLRCVYMYMPVLKGYVFHTKRAPLHKMFHAMVPLPVSKSGCFPRRPRVRRYFSFYSHSFLTVTDRWRPSSRPDSITLTRIFTNAIISLHLIADLAFYVYFLCIVRDTRRQIASRL